MGRVEYRHDASGEKVFRVRYSRRDITSQGSWRAARAWDTISVRLLLVLLVLGLLRRWPL